MTSCDPRSLGSLGVMNKETQIQPRRMSGWGRAGKRVKVLPSKDSCIITNNLRKKMEFTSLTQEVNNLPNVFKPNFLSFLIFVLSGLGI